VRLCLRVCASAVLEMSWRLAHLAGNLIRYAVDRPKTVTSKSTAVDNVTETDVACEKLILDAFRRRYPSAHFVAEESHKTGGSYEYALTAAADPNALTIVVDPIDGTTNFMHGLPFVCVSIGVMRGMQCRVGVIHAPLLGETYHSVIGRGAYVTQVQSPTFAAPADAPVSKTVPPPPMYPAPASSSASSSSSDANANAMTDIGSKEAESDALPAFEHKRSKSCPHTGAEHAHALVGRTTRLRVSGCDKVANAAFICEFGYDRTALGVDTIYGTPRGLLLEGVHAIRSFGSCALNVCMVAKGAADAYAEGRDTTRGTDRPALCSAL
jgi:fructose-1,6-bisphosphatase/inositol monophosphatase family enzyme